jgi:integrase
MTAHSALEHAVRMGLLPRNPADMVVSPKAERKQTKILREQDYETFWRALSQCPARDVALLALYTGARRGELLALTWGDVDLDHSVTTTTLSSATLMGTTSILTR